MLFVGAEYAYAGALNAPGGVVPGDLLFALMRCSTPSPAAINFAGWSKIGYDTSFAGAFWSMHTRIASGTSADNIPSAALLTTSSIAAYRSTGTRLAQTGNWGNGIVSNGSDSPLPGMSVNGRRFAIVGMSFAPGLAAQITSIDFPDPFTLDDRHLGGIGFGSDFAVAWGHSAQALTGTIDPVVEIAADWTTAIMWGQLIAFPGGSGLTMLL